jgi:hypothetical protein
MKCCPEFIPDIEKFLAVAIFKMAAKIKHCPISSKFDMWVDNDVPNWFPTLEIFQCQESIWDIIIYPQMKCRWNRTMLNLCGIVVAIWAVKIQHFPISSKFDIWVDNNVPNWFPTLKNFYRSPFWKWPPQYRKNSTLSDII